jgi:hypothetical protein
MTDRELLEAAYAAYRPGENYIRLVNDAGSDYWNPLTNSGDAFELMVKLRMSIVFGANYVIVDNNVQAPTINNADDPYAATRRAIVRAAAELGKEMK